MIKEAGSGPGSGAMRSRSCSVMTLWTIGHWVMTREEFLERLAHQHIEAVVDVRSSPGSRRSPQYNSNIITTWLAQSSIGYRHIAELGGRRPRQPRVDQMANAGWTNSSFKHYADFTLSAEFNTGLRLLTQNASRWRTAIMCGEPLPWRCHRLLISNIMAANGWRVKHIMPDRTIVHELGRWGARPEVVDGRVTYPATPHVGATS